jgi:hypothetical protein
VAVRRRRLESVLGGQPVLARLGECDLHGMYVRSAAHLAAHAVQRGSGLLLGGIALPELLSLTVDDADVHGGLVANDGPSAIALAEFHPLHLRGKLSTPRHRWLLPPSAQRGHDAASSVCAVMNRSISADASRRDEPICAHASWPAWKRR